MNENWENFYQNELQKSETKVKDAVDSEESKWVWKKQWACCCSIWISGPETAAMFGRSTSQCCWPLVWRLPILVWSIGTIAWSLQEFWGPLYMWPLYMTHWGLILIFLQSAFGCIVAVNELRGTLLDDAKYELPRYIKMYWTLYNMAIPIAFLITFFYWALLRGSIANAATSTQKPLMYSPDPTLDLFIHGVNSGVMLLELLISGHPSRLIHVWQPLLVACVYMLVGVTYYAAGGTDPAGNRWIYPMIDWTKPEQASLVSFLCAVYLCIMHTLVVLIASIRDKIARACCPSLRTVDLYDGCSGWSVQ